METASTKSTAAPQAAETKRNPWLWIPSLYFAQGLPYVAVNIISIILYKKLGLSNTEIALYTSWLNLPWVIKPFWSPIVEIFKTKRYWIVIMQFIVGLGLAGVALTIPADNFVKYTLAFFWLLAFSSATHDIAADGFYMLGLSKHQQAMFVGVRSTFFRFAMITGQGLLIMLAGAIESKTGLPPVSIKVAAAPQGDSVQAFSPETVSAPETKGDLRIVAFPEMLTLDPVLRDKAEVDRLIGEAKAWNQQHGFYRTESKSDEVEDPSWWQRKISAPLAAGWSNNISGPLAAQLRRSFPKEVPEEDADGKAANFGIVYLKLNGDLPENENVVVNFGLSSGDKSIRLLEGDRFTFNKGNATVPFAAVVQLDPKLTHATLGTFTARSGNIPLAWSSIFFLLAGLFIVFCVYHRFVLPRPTADVVHTGTASNAVSAFFITFGSFFKKPGIIQALAFILFYRFAEAQLVRLAAPFLMDAREFGGLSLTTGQVGFVYGTVGVVALLCGGISGGLLAARHGLRFWLPAMVCAINVPNLVYVFMAIVQPDSFIVINTCVAIEQFGYGFGFAAYLLYMIYFADGPNKTAHYAICTGFMALGMMIPGMFSGWLQEILGYKNFFAWVIIATIPSFLVAFMIKVDPEFGKKTAKE
ncbi:MAG: MFS transporter [Verrucomicrobia bacterium]|nr:MFS transporter [Verrucomicrobiota bacterium]